MIALAPRTDQCPPAEGRWDECLTYDEQFRTLAYVSYRGGILDGVAEDVRLTLSYQRQHERRSLRRPASFTLLGGVDDVDTLGFAGAARTGALRLGVAEMTRFGMKEPDMEIIARLFKRCLIEGKYVGDEVTEFRKNFQQVHYSFDDSKPT